MTLGDALRVTGVAAAAAFMPGARAAAVHQLQVETCWLKLAAMAPDRLAFLEEEVERRHALFAEVRRGSPRGGTHPRIAALESVINDTGRGYLA